MMKEMLNTYNKKTDLQVICPSCLRMDHFLNECPLINSTFKKEQIIDDYINKYSNERLKANRYLQKRKNALFNLKNIQEKSKDFEQFGISFYNSSG